MTTSCDILVIFCLWVILTLNFSNANIPEKYTKEELKLIDPDDPIVIEAVRNHGPLWSIVKSEKVCEDFEDCSSVSEYDCIRDTRKMMLSCRKTCSNYFKDEKNLPQILQVVGGIDSPLVDPFGFKIPICDYQQGFDYQQIQTYTGSGLNMDEYAPYTPKFTKHGFEKLKIPKKLYQHFRKKLEKNDKPENWEPEMTLAPGTINNRVGVEVLQNGRRAVVAFPRTQLLWVDNEDTEKIFKTLGPMADEWAGVNLVPMVIYGIRRYLNNSALFSHLDRCNTHVISAILNIGQNVTEDWPLFVRDNQGEDHVVTMQPGEMVWYESATVIHGRQYPMKGSSYDNIFVHFRPRGKDWFRKELHHMDPVSPISLEMVKNEQSKMSRKVTNWESYDYSSIKNRFHSYADGLDSKELVMGTDHMNEEGFNKPFKHLP